MYSVILPTYNEEGNIARIIAEAEQALSGINYEIIVVDDDSPDETWKTALRIAEGKDHVRVLRRVGRRGLSSAVIDGFLAAKGDVFAVMDADGQHDATLLRRLHESVASGADIAVGSRYMEGGSIGAWDERRFALSRLATRLAMGLCKVKVHDPMSGFFAIRRATFEDALPRLNPKGFKILLDFLVHIPATTRVTEIPFAFGERRAGESKLSKRVQIEFVEYLYDVTFGKWVPLLFVKYCIVGTFGLLVHLGTYFLISRLLSEGGDIRIFTFALSVILATEAAIVFNYLLNNAWTFAHVRLRGRAFVLGFLTFNIACAFGAVANVTVSTLLFSAFGVELASVVAGALVGVVWNYTMNRMFTWKL